MTLVEILRYPPKPATSTGDGHHQSNKKAARKAPSRHGGEAHGAVEAPQAFRELVVEELCHGDIHEHLGRSDQQVLQDLPADAESAGCVDADTSRGAHQPLLSTMPDVIMAAVEMTSIVPIIWSSVGSCDTLIMTSTMHSGEARAK